MMATEFAKRHDLLDYEFPADWIMDNVIRGAFAGDGMKTVRDLISVHPGGTREQLSRIGQSILIVITKAIDQKQR